MHHHNVPLPEINFLKLVKKGMILIYFNSKIDNNLLVSPLYSKLGKKYSDLIRLIFRDIICRNGILSIFMAQARMSYTLLKKCNAITPFLQMDSDV